MPVNARKRWSPLNHDAKFVNTNFPAPLDTNIGTDKKKVIYTGMWQVKFDWTTLQSVLLQKIHCSHCPEGEIETDEAKNTFSDWSLWKQFLFQKEQKSLKIKLNANKLQKKYSVSLSKIKKCRVEVQGFSFRAYWTARHSWNKEGTDDAGVCLTWAESWETSGHFFILLQISQ